MGDSMASPLAIEDQGRLLEDALAQVRQQTQMMRRLLETPGKLMDALKCRYVKSCAIFAELCQKKHALVTLLCAAQPSFLSFERSPSAQNSITSYIWQSSMH